MLDFRGYRKIYSELFALLLLDNVSAKLQSSPINGLRNRRINFKLLLLQNRGLNAKSLFLIFVVFWPLESTL